jgi:hypothetical protein
VVSLLPPLFVPIRRSCLVINLSSLVMYDYRGLGSAWDRIRPYWKQRTGPQSVTILDLGDRDSSMESIEPAKGTYLAGL